MPTPTTDEVGELIDGLIRQYEITSAGDTAYLLRRLVSDSFEATGRALFNRSGALTIPAGKIDLTEGLGPGRVEMFIVKDSSLLPESAGFIVPDGEQINLCDLRPGLFLYRGGLGLKTEYFTDRYADVYTADSGETFWGGTVDRSDRDRLIVQPVKFVAKAG